MISPTNPLAARQRLMGDGSIAELAPANSQKRDIGHMKMNFTDESNHLMPDLTESRSFNETQRIDRRADAQSSSSSSSCGVRTISACSDS